MSEENENSASKLNASFVCPGCGEKIKVDAEYESDKPSMRIDIASGEGAGVLPESPDE